MVSEKIPNSLPTVITSRTFTLIYFFANEQCKKQLYGLSTHGDSIRPQPPLSRPTQGRLLLMEVHTIKQHTTTRWMMNDQYSNLLNHDLDIRIRFKTMDTFVFFCAVDVYTCDMLLLINRP